LGKTGKKNHREEMKRCIVLSTLQQALTRSKNFLSGKNGELKEVRSKKVVRSISGSLRRGLHLCFDGSESVSGEITPYSI